MRFVDSSDTTIDKNSKIRLILVYFLTPCCEMILAKGILKETKLIRYIKFTHIMVSAEIFKEVVIFGRAITVIFAINCMINCDVAAIMMTTLLSDMLIKDPPYYIL